MMPFPVQAATLAMQWRSSGSISMRQKAGPCPPGMRLRRLQTRSPSQSRESAAQAAPGARRTTPAGLAALQRALRNSRWQQGLLEQGPRSRGRLVRPGQAGRGAAASPMRAGPEARRRSARAHGVAWRLPGARPGTRRPSAPSLMISGAERAIPVKRRCLAHRLGQEVMPRIPARLGRPEATSAPSRGARPRRGLRPHQRRQPPRPLLNQSLEPPYRCRQMRSGDQDAYGDVSRYSTEPGQTLGAPINPARR